MVETLSFHLQSLSFPEIQKFPEASMVSPVAAGSGIPSPRPKHFTSPPLMRQSGSRLSLISDLAIQMYPWRSSAMAFMRFCSLS